MDAEKDVTRVPSPPKRREELRFLLVTMVRCRDVNVAVHITVPPYSVLVTSYEVAGVIV